jgi:hypothetical protein
VKNRIRNDSEPYEGLLSIVKRWRLIGYGFDSLRKIGYRGMWCPHGTADYGNDDDIVISSVVS